MISVLPSILTSDPDEARALLSLCEDKVRRVHIDIVDGIFVDNKTITPDVFTDSETRIFLDYHLMVDEPIHWIVRCVRGSGDRIIGHVEYMSSQQEFITAAQENGIDVGLAIDLDTPVSRLDEFALPELDTIIVMSVKAGYGGQEFQPSVLEKVKELDALREKNGYSYNICDDGGVSLSTIGSAAKVGVDEVAVGRSLFEGDLEENIEKLKKASMR